MRPTAAQTDPTRMVTPARITAEEPPGDRASRATAAGDGVRR